MGLRVSGSSGSWVKRRRLLVDGFKLWLAIVGAVGFSQFIFEESLQVLMFSLWPMSDANQWDEVVVTLDLMEGINGTSRMVNAMIGWSNPLGFLAYRAYNLATVRYLEAYRLKVLARSPESLIGREVQAVLRFKAFDPEGMVGRLPGGTVSLLSPVEVGEVVEIRAKIESRDHWVEVPWREEGVE